ncbi:hypothetical protein BT93_L4213 [Corymbia citriodora subsp. variegata]|uniref:Uncharacterized protein n=1 Tax=Corymbia citriodora subsp. variegata TaxID=360336 RepID=A0A8T0CX34_CORYI|nr:hypothetical protein BT93_L4213 [Corymbia citriodora subsp. variegata]
MCCRFLKLTNDNFSSRERISTCPVTFRSLSSKTIVESELLMSNDSKFGSISIQSDFKILDVDLEIPSEGAKPNKVPQ